MTARTVMLAGVGGPLIHTGAASGGLVDLEARIISTCDAPAPHPDGRDTPIW